MNARTPPESLNEIAPKALLDAELPGQVELLFERADLGSQDWWTEVARLGTPLRGFALNGTIELTFLWRSTEAAQVFIDVYSHTPHISEALTELTRIGQTDVWYWRTRLPLDWCGSYFFLPATTADLPAPEGRSLRRQWWINLMERRAQADAFNLLPAHNGSWGLPLSGIQPVNAVTSVASATHAESHRPDNLIGRDKLRWVSEQLSNERDIWLYDARFIDGCVVGADLSGSIPLVLLLDGHYWAQQPVFLAQLENLTRTGQLPVAQYVFIDALSPLARSREMPCNSDFWLALQQELLSLLHDRYGVTHDPKMTLVTGQSFGGLSAVYATLNWPERFGRALSLSGSFWWPDAGETGAGGELVQQVLSGQSLRMKDLRKSSISLSIGCYEQDMLGVNQALRDALAAAKIPVTYREFRGGHDWLCWREELLQQLQEQLSQLMP